MKMEIMFCLSSNSSPFALFDSDHVQNGGIGLYVHYVVLLFLTHYTLSLGVVFIDGLLGGPRKAGDRSHCETSIVDESWHFSQFQKGIDAVVVDIWINNSLNHDRNFPYFVFG